MSHLFHRAQLEVLLLRAFLVPILPYSGFLWILRAVLVVLLLAHAGSAFYLWMRNRRARGTDRYAVKRPGTVPTLPVEVAYP